MAHKQIYYSDKYLDEHYEYGHVMLPTELSKQVPKTHLMSEEEWRRLGVSRVLAGFITCFMSRNHIFSLDDLFQKINKNEACLGIVN